MERLVDGAVSLRVVDWFWLRGGALCLIASVGWPVWCVSGEEDDPSSTLNVVERVVLPASYGGLVIPAGTHTIVELVSTLSP